MSKDQLSFEFYRDEFDELKGLAKRCYRFVRDKYPPVEGEGMDEWKSFIISETMLEMASRLEEIALRRQKTIIDLKYGKEEQ